MVGIVLYPVSKFGFDRNITRKLYLASTKDQDLLIKCKSERNPMNKWVSHDMIPASYDHQMKQEVKNHRIMKIRWRDEFLLFID